jgi:hypothetical protein
MEVNKKGIPEIKWYSNWSLSQIKKVDHTPKRKNER